MEVESPIYGPTQMAQQLRWSSGVAGVPYVLQRNSICQDRMMSSLQNYACRSARIRYVNVNVLMLMLMFATTSVFAFVLDSSSLLCNQTMCGVGQPCPLWIPMCCLPYESHWGGNKSYRKGSTDRLLPTQGKIFFGTG